MAKSRRGKTGKVQSKAEEIVETVETEVEAVVEDAADAAAEVKTSVEDAVTETVEGDSPSDAPEPEAEEVSATDDAVVIEEAEVVDVADAAQDAQAEDAQAEDVEADEAPAQDPAEPIVEAQQPEAPEPQVIRETVVERKSGFMSTALGGAVAAVVGFGAAQVVDVRLPFLPEPAPNPFEQEARTALQSQSEQIATLAAQSADTKKAVEIIDLAPVAASIAGLEDQISGSEATLKAMGDELAGFDSRLTAIEKAPMVDAVSPESIAAYERELDALRKSITDQQAALEVQKVEIQAMAAEAIQAETNAEEHATLAASRAALAEITALLQTGQPFAEPMAVLTTNGVDVPAALSAVAAEGVPTLAELSGEFPDLARTALSAARRAGGDSAEEGAGGFASFVQKQLGARSVTPREGSDPDAVLSRAEAAVKAGDLDTAFTEIDALPDAAKAELDGWLTQAALQRDAMAAAAALSQELNKQ